MHHAWMTSCIAGWIATPDRIQIFIWPENQLQIQPAADTFAPSLHLFRTLDIKEQVVKLNELKRENKQCDHSLYHRHI